MFPNDLISQLATRIMEFCNYFAKPQLREYEKLFKNHSLKYKPDVDINYITLPLIC
jgi:hypothetical protein